MKAVVLGAVVAIAADVRADPSAATVAATAQLGFTQAPFEAPALSEAKGHGFVFLIEAAYELAPRYVASVRVPAVLASVAQPAGAYTDRGVLGNPQLRLARVFERRTVAIMAGLEVGVPLASHDDDLLANRALAIADGIAGRGAPELFTPGVLPTTAFGELSFGARGWRVGASARVPLLLRVSDADMPSSTTNAVASAMVVSVQARRRVTRRLTAGVSTQLFTELAPVQDHRRDRGRLQDLEHVGLSICIGRRSELTLTFDAAIGGDLGGSTFGGGVRVVSTL